MDTQNPHDKYHSFTLSSLDALEFPQILEYLTSRAESPSAKEQISRIFPSSDVNWIRLEHKRVSEMRDYFTRGGSFPFATRDVRIHLQRADILGGMLEGNELVVVLDHLKSHRTFRKILDREKNKLPNLFDMCQNLEALDNLIEEFEKDLNPDGSVRDSALPELAKVKKKITQLQSEIRKKVESFISKDHITRYLRERTYSIRDGRYVIPVVAESIRKIKGIIHDRSATGGTVFIEPDFIVEPGNMLRYYELQEAELIRKVLRKLTALLKRNMSQIQINCAIMTRLDVIYAKMKFALDLNANVPNITSSLPLKILNGRHPLLVLEEKKNVVPLNLELGVDYTTLIISGPNAGGKSVALKCVGLLVMLTSCGIPIPASPDSEIPVFKGIFADIGDEQSISEDLSTFTAHLGRIKGMLLNSNQETLILIDEIGAGTDPEEGAAISISFLEKITSSGIPTIATTHSGVLKSFAHNTKGCANGSMMFDLKELQPTYKFVPNLPGSSYALEIAQRVGISDDLLSRARELMGSEKGELSNLLSTLTDKANEYEKLLVKIRQQSKEYENYEKEYSKKFEQIRNYEKDIKKRIRAEAENLMKESRREIERAIKDLREEQASKKSILESKKILKEVEQNVEVKVEEFQYEKKSRKPKKTKPAIKESLSDKVPSIGDWVVIDEGSTKGNITAITSNGQRICVSVGTIQLWLNKERIKIVEPPQEEAHKVVAFRKLPDVPLELDVRGLGVDEAIYRVENYILTGWEVGRHQLGIIHGKGAGILSRAIREYLKKSKRVSDYKFGEYGQGDYGVTIVTLKEDNVTADNNNSKDKQ